MRAKAVLLHRRRRQQPRGAESEIFLGSKRGLPAKRGTRQRTSPRRETPDPNNPVMSAKQEAIAYVSGKLPGGHPVLSELVKALNACADDGILKKLSAAYNNEKPTIEFAGGAGTESGAYYDFNNNKMVISPNGQAPDLADMFLFESFNCAHRKEYSALAVAFNGNNFPPMYFQDYGDKKSAIEGIATFEYLSLLREIQKNVPNFTFCEQSKRSLKSNENVASGSQMVARMTWTPHDPTGLGDWRFATPLHYAFRRVMELTPAQTMTRIKHLVISAAGGSGWGCYNEMDPNQTFQKWWRDQWPNLRPEEKPTSFIGVCDEASRVFRGKPGIHWKAIALADYQFNTEMELEARRLSKTSKLVGQAPQKW